MFITLLTDFGIEDEYVAIVKGVILTIHPSATFIDVTHEVPLGDVRRGGWLLRWSWSYFPKGTVHLTVVDPGVGSNRRILCLQHKGHLFLAPDNGIFAPLLSDVPRPTLYAVTQRRYALKKISHTFHGRDIFAPAAAYLSKGLAPHRLGPRVDTYKRFELPELLSTRTGSLSGEIIAFDGFGSAVTNLGHERLAPLARKGPLAIHVKGRKLQGIQRSYAAVPKGSPCAVIGSRGLLEISIRMGCAASSWHLQVGDPVEVRLVAP